MASSLGGPAHIHLFGNADRAAELVPVAKYLLYLATMGTYVGGVRRYISDGSAVVVKRVGPQLVAYIFGASPGVVTKPLPETKYEQTVLMSGWITDPAYTMAEIAPGVEVPSPAEFTATRSAYAKYRGHLRKRTRGYAPRLGIKPLAGWQDIPGIEDYVQAGVSTASMYSGTMKEVVQLALALGRPGMTEQLPPEQMLDYHIEYGSSWYITHGLCKATTGGWWVVEVSINGVVAAPLPVMRSDEMMARAEVAKFGGMPTGKLPSSGVALLEKEDIEDYFDGEPLLDVFHGWVFNKNGSECRNVSLHKSGSVWTTRLYSIKITIDPDNGVFTAELELLREARIARPNNWLDAKYAAAKAAYGNGDSFSGGFTTGLASSLQAYEGHLVGGFKRATDGARVDWGVSGEDTSWCNTAPPIQYFTRDTGVHGVATMLELPELEVQAGTAIDAPVFVSCIADEFHTVGFFWSIDPMVSPTYDDGAVTGNPHTDIGGDGYAVRKMTWFNRAGAYGVPPTVYSTHLDHRTPQPAVTTRVDGDSYYAYGELRRGDRPGGELYALWDAHSYTGRCSWLCHTELFLPHMSREDFQLLDLRSNGSTGIEKDGIVYGHDFLIVRGSSVNGPAIIAVDNALPAKYGATHITNYSSYMAGLYDAHPRVDKVLSNYTGGDGSPRYTYRAYCDLMTVFAMLGPAVPLPDIHKGDAVVQSWKHDTVIRAKLDLYQTPDGAGQRFLWEDDGFVFDKGKHITAYTIGGFPTHGPNDGFGNVARIGVNTADMDPAGVRFVLNEDYTVTSGFVNFLAANNRSHSPGYLALSRDQTRLYTYSNGLPSDYDGIEVNRLNAKHLRIAETEGALAGASAVGRPFAFFVDPTKPGGNRVKSFGCLPAGLNLEETDIISVVGITEDG